MSHHRPLLNTLLDAHQHPSLRSWGLESKSRSCPWWPVCWTLADSDLDHFCCCKALRASLCESIHSTRFWTSLWISCLWSDKMCNLLAKIGIFKQVWLKLLVGTLSKSLIQVLSKGPLNAHSFLNTSFANLIDLSRLRVSATLCRYLTFHR